MNAMHYDAAFTTFIEQMKLDKDVAQPWRNKAISRMQEAQAFIHMGLTVTNRKPDDEDWVENFACTCPAGGIKRDCPVHGKRLQEW
jgi:hypothetical protein